MDGLTQVMYRINEIEQRFGIRHINAQQDFSTLLNKASANHLASSQRAGATSGVYQGGNYSAEQTGAAAGASPDVTGMLNVAAQKYGVSQRLVFAIAQAESGFDPNAVSSAGAVGVMQLMPDTAAALGVRDINDPRENIDGGVAYLKQMLTTFDGDVSRAVAAYNAGPQAVKDYGGVPPYPETRAYVDKVLSLCK